MQNKVSMVNARIDPAIKVKAETILSKVGLTSAEAVRLFYTQICLHKGLPFEAKIPNKTTVRALHEADVGKTYSAKSIKELLDDIE